MVLGVPPLKGLAETELTWRQAQDPPLSGFISVTDGQWGEFPFDVLEVRLKGTPGQSFQFSQCRVRRAGKLQAQGLGSLTFLPQKRLHLNLSVKRLLLGYLKPFGFVEESDVVGQGQITISGDPDNPSLDGSLILTPGSYTPPTGFSKLTMTEGRIDFKGKKAVFAATLNDKAGTAVLIAGEATHRGLVPQSYAVTMTAPAAIQVDGLPRLFKGLARGKIRLDGSPARPALHGEITLEEGRLQTPPRRKKLDPDAFTERLDWDLTIRFGNGVNYAVTPGGVAALNVALISPKSTIQIRGRGEDFQVYGEVYAASGPLTFFGKDLWKKPPKK